MRIDRVVLMSLVSGTRWTPAQEIAVQLSTGVAQIRTALADAIADGELIDASDAGYRKYTEEDVAAETVTVPPLSFKERRAEVREGAATALSVALRGYRIAAGLSQNRLARETGIDPAYVNRIERGHQTQLSQKVALALADALDLTESMTDRLLRAAGLASVTDWQSRAEYAEAALARIEAALNYRETPRREEQAS